MADKESEYDMPDEGLEDMDVSEFDEPVDEGESDYGDEDWGEFDGDQYIDDGDGDGKAERVAAFNKMMIGGAVALALAVGGYFVMHQEKEPMGTPVMAKTGEMAEIPEGQKVEFHTDTKVAAKQAFGVRYGEKVDPELQKQEEEKPPAGLLNNPDMLAKIRGMEPHPPEPEEEISGAKVKTQGDDNRPVYQMSDEENPPMPSPIGAADSAAQDGGLIPLPEQAMTQQDSGNLKGPDDVNRMLPEENQDDQGRRLSFDDVLPAEDMLGQDGAKDEKLSFDDVRAAATMDDKAGAVDSRETARLQQRIDDLEGRLSEVDELKQTIKSLEGRLEQYRKEDKADRVVSAKSASPRPAATHKAVSRTSVYSQPSWVLKSAQPGKAMLSRKGSSDIVSVSAGETLSGIGKVTGVYMQGGRWIVEGTKGRITQ